MRRYAFCLLVLCICAVPTVARAITTCDSTYAQDIARQGYHYLDVHNYNDARMAAGQLALYAKNCDDPKVGYPSVVYSAYIGSAAFHGLGDDGRAAQALKMGLMVLDVLKKDGGYAPLYNAMQPKFIDLAREIKPVAAAAPAAPAPPAQAPVSP
jgi:hypothetical protein